MAILIIETNNPSAIPEAMSAAGAKYISISYGANLEEAVEVHKDDSWGLADPEPVEGDYFNDEVEYPQ